MLSNRTLLVLCLALCLATFLLAALPGTADVNVWKAWVDGLDQAGFVAGYNAGTGHIVHPPLGLFLLRVSNQLSPWLGLPDHVWPIAGWTGLKVVLWLVLTLGALLVYRITGRIGWAVLFQLAFLLNSVVYGYFDIFGVVFLMVALHAFATGRLGWGTCCMVLAALIKWQFLMLLPFVGLFVLREGMTRRADASGPWRRVGRAILPAAGLIAVVLAVVGRGTVLSLSRGIARKVLSGHALNLGWIITWAMHVRWPESYGTLDDGLISVIHTQDTRVLSLLGALFIASYGVSLWRLWRDPHGTETLLRAMLAGYLAYCLFNRGVHENHLVPAVAIAGYLAWYAPRWRGVAVVVAVAANVNMLFFYTLAGTDRLVGRMVFGVDLSLPLAVVYVLVLGMVCLKLCGFWPNRSGRHERRAAVA